MRQTRRSDLISHHTIRHNRYPKQSKVFHLTKVPYTVEELAEDYAVRCKLRANNLQQCIHLFLMDSSELGYCVFDDYGVYRKTELVSIPLPFEQEENTTIKDDGDGGWYVVMNGDNIYNMDIVEEIERLL